MNDDPQLIIFEPLKKPRTVVLKVQEDSGTDSATIFDENGHTVTNYNVLYDESKSATANPDKEKIFAYIENWELQNGEIVNTDKQARKIEKRKRLQAAKKRKKERNKKRKEAMKSLIHCAFDTNALTKTKDIQEERAILQAMKMQNLSIKNVLNVKKKTNGHINLNTNYRPLENSVIELGRRKTPIDVVVLDSDDDDIQINIDPPPQTQRRSRIVDFSNDEVIRDGSSFLRSDSRTRKRGNKNVEVVQIVDSSDSDVECLSNGSPSVESLSDDDDNSSNNSTTQNTQSDCPANSGASNTVQDEEISHELNNLVDNFVNRYIQNVMPVLTDEASAMETEPAAPQLLITEPISLQITSSLASKKSKKRKDKHVVFDNLVQDMSTNDDELVIVENEPPQNEPIDVDSNDEQVQTDEQAEVDDSLEKSQSISDDSMEFNGVSEDHYSPIDFDSIPSPDYNPVETIPATASNLKAFADFIRSQKERYEQNEEDTSCFEVPKSTPSVTERKRKSSNQCHSLSHFTPYTSKQQSHPWSKRCSEKSEDIVKVDEDPTNQQQQPSKPKQKRCNDTSKDSVEIEHVASSKPCQNACFNKSDEIEIIEDPPMSSSEPQSFLKNPAVKNLRNSLPNQRPPTQSFQKRKSLPAFDRDTAVGRNFQTPISSSNRRNFSNRRCPPRANDSETNSAVAFFDKNSIRIGESGSKPKNICHNKEPTSEPVNSGRTFYPKTFLQCDDEANEQLQNNSQRAPFNKKPFCQRENRQCGTMPRYENKTPWQCESGSETPVSSARLEKGSRWPYKSASKTPVSIVPPRKQEHWQNESESRARVTGEPYERKIPWKEASKSQLRVENDDENYQHQQQQYRESIRHEFHPPNEAVKRNWNHPETHEESNYYPEKHHGDTESHSLVDNSCESEDNQPQQYRQFYPRNMPVNRNRNHRQSYEDSNYYSEDVCDDEELDPQVDKYCQSDQHQSQQYCEPIHEESHPRNVPVNRNRYHPEPYEESKFYPENVQGDRFNSSNRNFHRNSYHPEPYEEQKFIPNFGPAQFQQRPMAWRSQNRTPYRNNRFNRNREYYNGPPPNHFNRGGRLFRPRFVPNKGQRYPNRGNMQNMARFNQPPEGNRQYSNSQQLPCDSETNQYRNQSQTVPSSVPEQPIPEETLFTRRSKFKYKANVSDFDNTNADDRGPPPYRQNPRNRDQNANFHRANDFESYESNVARNLHSSSGNKNTFSWENNQACDYVPFDANRPVSSSAPWNHDYSNSDYDPSIKALSRQVWLNDTLNSKT